MGVNEHFEPLYNAVSCQLRGFKTASKKAITIPAILLSLTAVAIANDSSYEDYQLRLLKSPTAKELESERQGRVFIYDDLKDYHVQMALDEHFDRVESMMFTGVIVTDESNQPKKKFGNWGSRHRGRRYC